jgi:hypothetical protein
MAAALCYGVRGGGAQRAAHLQPGNYDIDSLIEVLAELRRFLGGEKATLLWDVRACGHCGKRARQRTCSGRLSRPRRSAHWSS